MYSHRTEVLILKEFVWCAPGLHFLPVPYKGAKVTLVYSLLTDKID